MPFCQALPGGEANERKVVAGHLVEFADVDGFARILEARILPELRNSD